MCVRTDALALWVWLEAACCKSQKSQKSQDRPWVGTVAARLSTHEEQKGPCFAIRDGSPAPRRVAEAIHRSWGRWKRDAKSRAREHLCGFMATLQFANDGYTSKVSRPFRRCLQDRLGDDARVLQALQADELLLLMETLERQVKAGPMWRTLQGTAWPACYLLLRLPVPSFVGPTSSSGSVDSASITSKQFQWKVPTATNLAKSLWRATWSCSESCCWHARNPSKAARWAPLVPLVGAQAPDTCWVLTVGVSTDCMQRSVEW